MTRHSASCAEWLLLGALCTCVASITFPERYELSPVGQTAMGRYFLSPELKALINGDLKRRRGALDIDHGHVGSSGAPGPAFYFRST